VLVLEVEQHTFGVLTELATDISANFADMDASDFTYTAVTTLLDRYHLDKLQSSHENVPTGRFV
jgi:hypothetical protein